MPKEEKKVKVFDPEYIVKDYSEIPMEKPKPVVKTKTLPKPIPKVNLKDTLEKLNRLESAIFKESGNHRWTKARTLLVDIVKDVETKLKE